MEIPEYSPFDWLINCPANDGNFIAALHRATMEQLRQAVRFMDGRPGNKTRIKSCQIELKRRMKHESKTAATNESV